MCAVFTGPGFEKRDKLRNKYNSLYYERGGINLLFSLTEITSR